MTDEERFLELWVLNKQRQYSIENPHTLDKAVYNSERTRELITSFEDKCALIAFFHSTYKIFDKLYPKKQI